MEYAQHLAYSDFSTITNSNVGKYSNILAKNMVIKKINHKMFNSWIKGTYTVKVLIPIVHGPFRMFVPTHPTSSGFESTDFFTLSPNQGYVLFIVFVDLQLLIPLCDLKCRKLIFQQIIGRWHVTVLTKNTKERRATPFQYTTWCEELVEGKQGYFPNFAFLCFTEENDLQTEKCSTNKRGSWGLFQTSSRLSFKINYTPK